MKGTSVMAPPPSPPLEKIKVMKISAKKRRLFHERANSDKPSKSARALSKSRVEERIAVQ
jgi:hypothetical protein